MTLRRHPSAHLVAGDDAGLLSLLAAGTALRASGANILPTGGDPDFVECATGGTGGAPKIVRRTARSWQLGFERDAELFGIGPGTRVATLGLLGHSLSFYALAGAAHLGAGLVPLHGLRPDRQARALRGAAATHLWATPSQLRLLLPHGAIPSLERVLVGGGALDGATRKALVTTWPDARITTFYGTSETSFVTLDAGAPYPGVEAEIRENGLIWVRSPYLFEGYTGGGDPDTRWDDDGWLTVGEIGRRDAAGQIVPVGRASRLVNVADTLVSPEPAETLLACAADAPVAVLPRPDALRGTTLAAIRQGPDDPALDARLLALCRHRLGPLAAPRTMTALPVLPLLPSGKPDLATLATLVAGPA